MTLLFGFAVLGLIIKINHAHWLHSLRTRKVTAKHTHPSPRKAAKLIKPMHSIGPVFRQVFAKAHLFISRQVEEHNKRQVSYEAKALSASSKQMLRKKFIANSCKVGALGQMEFGFRLLSLLQLSMKLSAFAASPY